MGLMEFATEIWRFAESPVPLWSAVLPALPAIFALMAWRAARAAPSAVPPPHAPVAPLTTAPRARPPRGVPLWENRSQVSETGMIKRDLMMLRHALTYGLEDQIDRFTAKLDARDVPVPHTVAECDAAVSALKDA